MLTQPFRHFALLLVCLWVFPSQALATLPDPTTPEPEGRWQGAYIGFELRTGASFPSSGQLPVASPLYGGGVRVATLMSLIDLELYAQSQGLSLNDAPNAPPLQLTSLGADIRLHPFFMSYFQASFWDLVEAGFHITLGLGADILENHPQTNGTEAAFGWSLGLGLDFPLTAPAARPWSLWLGVGWRYAFSSFATELPTPLSANRNMVLIQLGMRFHNTSFARFPKPTELHDREPRTL